MLLLAAGVATPALADWTASGTFQYVDREFDQTGFTGTEPFLPVRLADIEIVDAALNGKKAILATGATDQNGAYSIVVRDRKTRDVYVRVVTSSESTPDLFIDVRDSNTNQHKKYAVATNTITGHASGMDINFGTATIGIGQGGEAFNLYDQVLRGMDYLATFIDGRPGSDEALAVVWGINNGVGGSSYSIGSTAILLRDTAGYDDTVVLHEMGHHVVWQYLASSSPGGAHTFSWCDLDLRLAFQEGWVTYWGNSVLRYHDLPRSNIYVRSNGGAAGPGSLVRWADLEDDQQYLCSGSTSEVNVFTVLWDIADGPTTTDTTPGEDDDHDLLDLPDEELWEVMATQMGGKFNISLETFWDEWFNPPLQNGFRSELIAIADHVLIEYHEDELEANDTATEASFVPLDGSLVHNTFFSDPELDGEGAADSDLFLLQASGGVQYVVETTNLLSDGNTILQILDSDGVTPLATNDDRSASDPSSLVIWVAPRSDTFYVRVTHATDVGIYGSYDLRIAGAGPVDNDGDGFDTTTDCNDDDIDIHPGAIETCDGVDQDCDGAVDNGFDVDGDGYTTCGGDCDDDDADVNPGMAEVPDNDIDDNCDGTIDEVAPSDTVTITQATWKKKKRGQLIVEANSDQEPDVTLTVVGFDVMIWNPDTGKYTYTSPARTPNPGSVTVTSSGGGSDTAPVE